MNVVLGMALLLLIAVFSIITSKEKGNRRKKGARWIHRWSRKKGWELPEWLTDECIWQTELAALAAGMLLVVTGMVGHAENMQAVSELRRTDRVYRKKIFRWNGKMSRENARKKK